MTTHATPGQAQADAMNPTSETATTVIARYLAAGGAHVTVSSRYRAVEADDFYTVDCEACGPLDTDTGHPNHYVEKFAHQGADRHAAGCRRIPERMWPEDGTS
jgi:hypothetical protein